jgi:hypothetical protein
LTITAALVGSGRLLGAGGTVLVGHAASQRENGGHRTGVDNPFDPAGQRSLHHRLGHCPVVAHDLLRIGRPDAIVGGDVEQLARALERGVRLGRIPQIRLDELTGKIREIVARAARPDGTTHLAPARRQHPGHRRADESGCAGHDCPMPFHGAFPRRFCPGAKAV